MAQLSHTSRNGSAMLAVFCNLSIEDQVDFRPWLIQDMFPARLDIGFKNCASFNLTNGEGSKFVTLYEIPSVGYLYDLPYQSLRKNRTIRDANYHRKFQNLERYILAWTGPEISRNIKGLPKYIIISRFDIKEQFIPEFNIWFISTYIPNLLNMDNTIGIRRYISLEGPHKNFIIKESLKPEKLEANMLTIGDNKFEKIVTGAYERIAQLP